MKQPRTHPRNGGRFTAARSGSMTRRTSRRRSVMFRTGSNFTNPERKRGDNRALRETILRCKSYVIPSLALRVSVVLLLPGTLFAQPFRINVIDDLTNRGVPLVELRTVNSISYFTDSNGIVAFDEPGLFDKDV